MKKFKPIYKDNVGIGYISWYLLDVVTELPTGKNTEEVRNNLDRELYKLLSIKKGLSKRVNEEDI